MVYRRMDYIYENQPNENETRPQQQQQQMGNLSYLARYNPITDSIHICQTISIKPMGENSHGIVGFYVALINAGISHS